MYEEPYKWVEAVGNRRQYLDDQFKQGSPVVALACDAGIILMTISKGTPKLYEIYDRLAFGGMGHPADLEKLRFTLLEMAHVEGFNRSPSDVTGSRMVKYGIAPVIKQAFEEVFKAPFIVKLLLAELRHKAGRDSFLIVNYDGTFEEGSSCAVLAASKSVEQAMVAYIRREAPAVPSVEQAVDIALRAWGLGDRSQREAGEESSEDNPVAEKPATTEKAALYTYVRDRVEGKNVECALLDRNHSGSSKYRALASDEIVRLLPKDLKTILS